MIQLDVLNEPANRIAIFLAEAIGWLHDYRKCSEEQLRGQAVAGPAGQGLPRSTLENKYPHLGGVSLQIPFQSTLRTVSNLLDDRTWDDDLLGKFLWRCHDAAHFDKQIVDSGKQSYPGARISTPFGFETEIPPDLTSQLWGLPWQLLANTLGVHEEDRRRLQEEVSVLFSKAIADTRRPLNEVDLWSWGLLVGALYKAALARTLLSGTIPAIDDLQWRLLGIRVDGPDFLFRVTRIPDLLARRQLLVESLESVRHLLELTYPIATEVYRDQNGAMYVVPDLPDLLNRTGGGTSLQKLILQEFAKGGSKTVRSLQLGGELIPHIELETKAWSGWNRNAPAASSGELQNIGRFLSEKFISLPSVDEVERSWQSEKVGDICTACGLRPQGPGEKSVDRGVCSICEARRMDRSKEWVRSQSAETIWTDEVSDVNGRLALIVGQFELAYWLDCSLLQSLFVVPPGGIQGSKGKLDTKNPSFSRLWRIWETTTRFWQDVQTKTRKDLAQDRCRFRIHLDGTPNLGPFHVYDLDLGTVDLSVVWAPEESGGCLISADNLSYIGRQIGTEASIYNHPPAAAALVEEHLRGEFVKNNRQAVLNNPDARANRNSSNLLSGFRISKLECRQCQYPAVISILAEPHTFMMLVPADQSLAILHDIKEKYEVEMGKVRDRLPISLGVVYATRRLPMRAVFDAGRAMLDIQRPPELWSVQSITRQSQANGAHFSQVVALELQRGGQQLTWRIPVAMGDGTTEDQWYPYVFLEIAGDDTRANAANRRVAKASRPLGNGLTEESWVVHVGDLRTGEAIYIQPSTFDFEFLDVTSRRFAIYYDEHGERPRATRPFHLEDLDRLDELWNSMRCLSVSQRHQVVRTIEATREEWYGKDQNDQAKDDKVFQQFVADTLAGAAWREGKSWNKISADHRNRLIQAGAKGELADIAELHMEILKER